MAIGLHARHADPAIMDSRDPVMVPGGERDPQRHPSDNRHAQRTDTGDLGLHHVTPRHSRNARRRARHDHVARGQLEIVR